METRREGNMRMKVESGLRKLQAKECHASLAATASQEVGLEHILSQSLQRNNPANNLTADWESIILLVLSHQVCGDWLWQPSETETGFSFRPEAWCKGGSSITKCLLVQELFQLRFGGQVALTLFINGKNITGREHTCECSSYDCQKEKTKPENKQKTPRLLGS